ncbi:MAG: DUF4384 domain-containing protein [Parvibaculaceae bacterium]
MSNKHKKTLIVASSLALMCAVYGIPIGAQADDAAPAPKAEQPAPQAEQPAPQDPAADAAEAEEADSAEQPAAAQQPPAQAEEPAQAAQQPPAQVEQPAVVNVVANPSDPAPENAQKAIENIPQPTNDIEKAAFAALDKHCARCHQDGALENRVKPAGGFGNILLLQAMARNPGLVIPGNPDASELIKQIASGNMPYDIKDGSNFLAETPTEAEVAAIRAWIVSLKLSAEAACAARDFVDNEEMVNAIANDLDQEPDHRVKGMRYISLANLYNACSTDEEMKVYQQAVVKLLNSLSTNPEVLTLQTVDEHGTLIKFNLDDLNWNEEDWNKIIKVYPYAVKPDVKRYGDLVSRVNTKVPYVRGDWLAFTAARPALYHELLRLPKTAQDLEKSLNLDVKSNIEKFLVTRVASRKSFVSQNNRLIERHNISTGYFWTSYDFEGNKGVQSLFEHPLGPFGDNAFHHDGGESIWSLPNGFQAYYLNKSNGEQLDKGPTSIVRDKDRKDFAVTNGISCMGCHDQGIRLYIDQVRAHVLNDRSFSKDVRDKVEALYPVQEEVDRILKTDMQRFQDALKRAGIDANAKIDGIEMINALSNHYERDLTLVGVAAEFTIDEKKFEELAIQETEARRVLNRVKQASIPRDEFEAEFSQILSQVTDDEMIKLDEAAAATEGEKKAEVAKVNEGDSKVDGKTALTLVADKTEYAVNDKPVFIVQSDTDCSLTLINVDAKGTGTVLFPNKFQQDSFIKAKQAFEFPAPDAPFQFRMQDPGLETVIALCNPKSKTRSVDNITHNFDAKAFTSLGEYEKYVTRAIAVEAAEVKKEAVEAKKVAEAKTETAEVKTDATAVDENVASRSGVSRAAIKVTVK